MTGKNIDILNNCVVLCYFTGNIFVFLIYIISYWSVATTECKFCLKRCINVNNILVISNNKNKKYAIHYVSYDFFISTLTHTKIDNKKLWSVVICEKL